MADHSKSELKDIWGFEWVQIWSVWNRAPTVIRKLRNAQKGGRGSPLRCAWAYRLEYKIITLGFGIIKLLRYVVNEELLCCRAKLM